MWNLEISKSKPLRLLLLVTCLAIAVGGCSSGPSPTASPEKERPAAVPFSLTSTAFAEGEPIPRQYTCDGEDISPPLQWRDVPEGTRSFALVADDPDAPGGTWDHWLLYNLPAEARSLPEGVPPDAELSDGSRHGQNSWPRLGYGGPCPPSGTHRYFFKLYALDMVLELDAGASKERLSQAMEGHILAEAELMGMYTR
jgi:Raf kinase inhibitor-like YbhB/YbcL family protein